MRRSIHTFSPGLLRSSLRHITVGDYGVFACCPRHSSKAAGCSSLRWLSTSKPTTTTTTLSLQETPNQSPTSPNTSIHKKSLSIEQERIREMVTLHLLQKYSTTFPFSSGHRNPQEAMQQQPLPSLPKLLHWTGFRKVSLPNPQTDSVPLAEGVMAIPKLPSKRRRNNTTRRNSISAFYRRPDSSESRQHSHSYSSSDEPLEVYVRPEIEVLPQSSEKLSPLVEPDLTIYRILEELVDHSLRQRHQSLHNWWQGILQHPLQTIRHFQQALQQAIGSLGRKKEERITAPEEATKDTTTRQEAPSSSTNDNEFKQFPKQSQSTTTNNSTHLESIILVDHAEQQQTTWISSMDPQHRLLAFPLQLSHKTASTLISVSLVVFGALPLTYRSVQFALAYPLAARAMAASVLFTILYGIYSGRAAARTNQARLIAQGLQERVHARNEAVMLLLEREAMQLVTDRILAQLEKENKKVESTHDVAQIQQWVDEEMQRLESVVPDDTDIW